MPRSTDQAATLPAGCELLEGDPHRARLRLAGPLLGHPGPWEVSVTTLTEALRQHPAAGGVRQFIDIDPNALHIDVGLAVPRLDPVVLRNTFVMLRNYKRLRPGRHEWGDPCYPQR